MNAIANVLARLPGWFRPGDARPADEIEDEVAEELAFHLDQLTEDNLRSGMADDEARRRAAERFGDFDSLVRRCRTIKQGDVPMLRRVQAVLTLLLLVAVVFVGWGQWSTRNANLQFMNQTTAFLTTIRSDLEGMRAEMKPQPAAESDAPAEVEAPLALGHLSGVVIDEDDQPVADALVMGVVKTWPNGRYHQDTWSLTANSVGRFVKKDAFPKDQGHEFLLSVFAEGFALTSHYVSRVDEDGPPPNKFAFRLTPSTPIRVLVLGGDEPLAGAVIRPVIRQAASGTSHLVYSQGAEMIEVKTNGAGRAVLPWFAAGDTARVRCLHQGLWGTEEFLLKFSPEGVATIESGDDSSQLRLVIEET